jgi:hypothetical protein
MPPKLLSSESIPPSLFVLELLTVLAGFGQGSRAADYDRAHFLLLTVTPIFALLISISAIWIAAKTQRFRWLFFLLVAWVPPGLLFLAKVLLIH